MKQLLFGIAYSYYAGSFYVHDGFFNSLFWLLLFLASVHLSWQRAVDFGGGQLRGGLSSGADFSGREVHRYLYGLSGLFLS